MFDPPRENSVFYCSVNELALVVFPNNLGVAEGVADGVGFEPTRSVNPCRFSRPVPSTTRPPIRISEFMT